MRATVLLLALCMVSWAAAATAQANEPSAGPPPLAPAAEAPEASEPTAPVTLPAVPAPAEVLEAVEFTDRVYFKEETLLSMMRHRVGQPLDRALLDDDAATIQAAFQERGYLRAGVRVEVRTGTPTSGRIARFVIDAGERAVLRSVEINGNIKVSDDELREGLFSRGPEPLGLLTRAGLFHRPYLDQDAQRLVANYYKRGYLEGRVAQTRVTATPDQEGIIVSLDVVEGPYYELAGLEIAGELPPGAESAALRERVTIKDGEAADVVTIGQQADALLDGWRERGYPFARFEQRIDVAPPPSGNSEHRAIVLTLSMVKGETARVRSVRIEGNKGTFEAVVRRDVLIVEGADYDHQALKKTERELMQTGFYQAVSARAVPTEDPGFVDIVITITENQTWLLSIVPLVDSSESLALIGIIGDRNLLGSGIFTTLVGTLSANRQIFDFTVSDPRFLGTRLALTGELHRRELNFASFRVVSEFGGGVRASLPILPDELERTLFVGAGVGSEYLRIANFDGDRAQARGLGDGKSLALGSGDIGLGADASLFPDGMLRNTVDVSILYDGRDSRLLPRNGVSASLRSSYGGLLTLSGASFLSTSANLGMYWTPVWGITLKSNTDAGFVFDPHGGPVPVSDRFFLGGTGSMRGYFFRTISPVRPVDGLEGGTVLAQTGGTSRLVQNLEVEFPLGPGVPLRGFVFADAGNTFDDGELASLFSTGALDTDRGADLPLGLFYSTGFGVVIDTPVLPFRFEWSVPLTRRGFDQPFAFFLGFGSAL